MYLFRNVIAGACYLKYLYAYFGLRYVGEGPFKNDVDNETFKRVCNPCDGRVKSEVEQLSRKTFNLVLAAMTANPVDHFGVAVWRTGHHSIANFGLLRCLPFCRSELRLRDTHSIAPQHAPFSSAVLCKDLIDSFTWQTKMTLNRFV